MPFKSEKQRRWMHANNPKMAAKWEKKEKKMKREQKVKELIKKMVREELAGLDEAAKRDYKAEYKKFQSSDKSKKYRAELNKYNSQKGTYGNGDGKDASHKGGKIVGFEKESVNRGRAEKSRLKKEGKLTERNEEHFKKSVEMMYKDIDRLIKTFNTTDYKKNKKAKKFIYTAQQLKLKLHMALSGITHNVREGNLSEDFKNNEWEVYVADEKGKEKIVKVAKSKRAGVILYNKLINTDKYHEVGMRVIKEGKLKETLNKLTEKLSKSEIKKMKDKFDKTGKLPPHLVKLSKLIDKHTEIRNVIVPGLEWMADIDEGKVDERIDMTINNLDMWKREKKWNRYNKATDAGKTVFVKLLKDKKTHYVWQVATASSIQVTDLAGKKQFSIKPKDVYEVVELPHTGYKVPKGFNEGKLNERLHVVDERYVGKFIIWVLQDGNKIRTAVMGKKGFDNFSSNDPDDLKKLWNLSKKYKGKPIPDIATEGKLTEAKETIFDVAAKVMKDSQNYNYKSKKGMVKVDMQTANLLTKVWKKVSPQMKKHLAGMGESNPAGLVQTLWAAVK